MRHWDDNRRASVVNDLRDKHGEDLFDDRCWPLRDIHHVPDDMADSKRLSPHARAFTRSEPCRNFAFEHLAEQLQRRLPVGPVCQPRPKRASHALGRRSAIVCLLANDPK